MTDLTLSKKLTKIALRCDCGMSITMEDVFPVHGNAEKTLDFYMKTSETPIFVSDDVKKEIVEENVLVMISMRTEMYVAPLTVAHYDMEKAIDVAYERLKSMGYIR